MSAPPPTRHRRTSWSRYDASLGKRGWSLIWIDERMAWLAPGQERPGRTPVFSNVAIQVRLTIAPSRDHALHDPAGQRAGHHTVMSREGIEALFERPLRQTAGMVAALLRLAALDRPLSDLSTLCRRRKTLAVQRPHRNGPVPGRDMGGRP